MRRLERKAGSTCKLVLLHPTEKTVRYTSLLNDQKVPTRGQLAVERVKSSGSLFNYALYTFTECYFKKHNPRELRDLWLGFKRQIDDKDVPAIQVFNAWKKNLLKTKFEIVCNCLRKYKIEETLRTQYVRYVNSVLSLGFVVYREPVTTKQTTTTKSRPRAKCRSNNNFTETSTSTSAFADIEDAIGLVQKTMGDKIVGTDEVIVAVDHKSGEFHCEPIVQDKTRLYSVYLFGEPTHHNPCDGYTIDSICAKIDPHATEIVDLYNIFKQSTIDAALPCRALLTSSSDDTTTGKLNKTTNLFDGGDDDEDRIDTTVSRFLTELHKKRVTGQGDTDGVVRDLICGRFNKYTANSGSSSSCAVKKPPLPTIELMNTLSGPSIVEKGKRDFSASFLAKVDGTKKDDHIDKTLIDYFSTTLRKSQMKIKTYEQCIGSLSAVSKRLAHDKQTLTDKCAVLEGDREMRRQREEEEEQSPFLTQTFGKNKKRKVEGGRQLWTGIIPDGFKVVASSVTPHALEYVPFYNMYSDYWLSVLRDHWGFVPVYNPTGEKIDEKPTRNTEQVLYKPFLELMGLDTFFTLDIDEPLATMSQHRLFSSLFEGSLAGQYVKMIECQLDGYSTAVDEDS